MGYVRLLAACALALIGLPTPFVMDPFRLNGRFLSDRVTM